MLNQSSPQEKKVYILPTQRWISETITIPYCPPVTRETHVTRVMIVNTMQALFLTHNFFARFCDSAGNFVTTQEEALVSESTLSTVNHQPVMQTYTPVELVPVYPEAVQAEEAAKASATALAEPQNLIPAVENYTAPIVVDSESNAPSTGVVTGEGTLQSAIEDAVVMTVEEPTSTVIEEGAAAEPASTEIEKTMTTAIDESGVAPIEIDPAKVGASSAKKTTAKK